MPINNRIEPDDELLDEELLDEIDFNDEFEDEDEEGEDFDPDPFIPKKVKEVRSAHAIEDLKYRIVIRKAGREIVYTRCPKDFEGSDIELLDKIYSGSPNFHIVDGLPVKEKEKQKKNKVRREVNLNRLRPAFNLNQPSVIPYKEFMEENNKKFSHVSNRLFIPRPGENQLFMGSLGRRMCGAFFQCICHDRFASYRGFTTGRVDENTGHVEVMVTKFIRVGTMTFYTRNAGFQIKWVNPHELRFGLDDHIYYDLLKIKIVNHVASSDAFGFRKIKKLMEGKTYISSDFRIIYNFDSVKLKDRVNIVEIKGEDGKYVKFLFEDLNFIYPDCNTAKKNAQKKNRIIEKGRWVLLKNPKRTSLEKNTKLRVSSVLANDSNKKNSQVSVMDATGKNHIVLLKQLKAI